ncbi:lipid-binding SYLF domain-containing protein [Geothermobacter hydrogeniphilus]|uniref:Ysc84 actin-binding domain-containing protein n=1 Tax=Geothermobacter hydrogeniphilus TaxID=1969733 RepID=A0A1X0Y5Y7_9BACT|nr:lipid-binding SYLF domain-containing protein [Geothermobacter hydrogeniphilus]ORJ60482.1 hypothetical protein B5V00_07930 [Geothermobacter hydrogeniphilus]
MRFFLIFLLLLLFVSPVQAAKKQSQTVLDAIEVVHEINKIPEQGIPPALLNDAYGLAIIPGMLKAGFIIGGKFGNGVLLTRGTSGRWNNPVFVSLIGGSFGWQIGAQSTDVILVFMTEKSINDVFEGKITLGVDAAIAAGPVGRRVEGSTDITLKAEILSYSRSRGLFAGVSLEGASLAVDDDADGAFYGREGIRPDEILKLGYGRLPIPARSLLDTLNRSAAKGK